MNLNVNRVFLVLALVVAFMASPAHAATVIVDKGGTGNFTTIQGAIDDAGTVAGTQIQVIDTTGTGYVESVEISKSGLVIVSNVGVGISGDGGAFSFDGTRTGAFGIAPSVTGTKIQGFGIAGGGGSGTYGVWMGSGADSTIVRENTFAGTFAAAVATASGGAGTLSGLTITQNSITDYELDGIQIASGAVNFTITENSIYNATNNGGVVRSNIYIDDTGNGGVINYNSLFGRSLINPGAVPNVGWGLFLDGYMADGLAGYLDATLNWWNDADGPRPESSGAESFFTPPYNTNILSSGFFFGGPVGAGVDFYPWLPDPYVIPEPATLTLLGLGALLMTRRKRTAK